MLSWKCCRGTLQEYNKGEISQNYGRIEMLSSVYRTWKILHIQVNILFSFFWHVIKKTYKVTFFGFSKKNEKNVLSNYALHAVTVGILRIVHTGLQHWLNGTLLHATKHRHLHSTGRLLIPTDWMQSAVVQNHRNQRRPKVPPPATQSRSLGECSITHLQSSLISKIFPGVILPPPPVKKEGGTEGERGGQEKTERRLRHRCRGGWMPLAAMSNRRIAVFVRCTNATVYLNTLLLECGSK